MTSADSRRVDQSFLANAMASFLQIGALLVLLIWCFNIIRPFFGIVVWAIIIAVAIYPLHVSLTQKLGGREKVSSVLLVLLGLAIILVPTWILGESTLGSLKVLAGDLKEAREKRLLLAKRGDRDSKVSRAQIAIDAQLQARDYSQAWQLRRQCL